MAQPPYGPPGPYPYPPYRYVQHAPPVGYGAPGLYGQPPRPPPKKNMVPWLVAGGAVLLSALGILLVVLLGGGGSRTPAAATSSAAVASSSAAGAGPSRPRHAGLPGGAPVADKATGAGQARFARSGDTALAWLQGLADGDFRAAYELSCAGVQQSATAAAPGEAPARSLATYFFEHTLSGRGFTDGSLDSVMYNSASDSDIASFTLRLDDGEEFVLLVYVQSDGTVCDFV